MNINIRLLENSELELANKVYNDAYGNIRPDNYFKWEFVDCPSGKAIYVIAEDLDKKENKIIGTQCAIPIEFIDSSGSIILTAKSEDTFVHPDYRGQKLFERMYELLFEECKKSGIAFLWGFTYAKKPFLKLGFEIPFETLQGICVKNPFKTYKYLINLNKANRFIDKLKIFGFVNLAWIYSIKRFPQELIRLSEIENTKIPQKLDLVNSILNLKDVSISIKQDEDYQRWRINDNPYANNYIQFSDSLNYCLIGNSRPEGFAYIEELLIDPLLNKKEQLALVNSFTKKLFESENKFCIRFWGFNTNTYNKNEIKLLKKNGFVFIKKGTSFVWKNLGIYSDKIDAFNLLLSRIYTQGNR